MFKDKYYKYKCVQFQVTSAYMCCSFKSALCEQCEGKSLEHHYIYPRKDCI